MEEQVSKQRKILNTYYEKYGDFGVAMHTSPTSNWWHTNYKEMKELYPNDPIEHRQIFPDEVIIDIDDTDLTKCIDNIKAVEERLKSRCLTHSLWNSGSVHGYHFHIFFPQLMNYKEEQRTVIKEAIVKDITEGLDLKYDTQLFGKHLIRAEHGYYEKKHPQKIYKTLVTEQSYMIGNLILKKHLNALRTLRPTRKKVDVQLSEDNLFNCNRYFLKGNLKDGKKRALFIINGILKQRGKSNEEVYQKLIEYADKFRLKGMNQTLYNMAYQESGKKIGCKYQRTILEELGQTSVCEGCPLKTRYET